jgi:thymidine kinase
VRFDSTGKAVTAGDQVQIGGNETYLSLCRKHYRTAVEDGTTPALPI